MRRQKDGWLFKVKLEPGAGSTVGRPIPRAAGKTRPLPRPPRADGRQGSGAAPDNTGWVGEWAGPARFLRVTAA